MRWNGQGGVVCPLRGQSLESRLAAQRSVGRAAMADALTQRDEAEALAIALEAGVIEVSAAIRWADQVIEACSDPTSEVVAVSLATKAPAAEMAHLLRNTPGELSQPRAARRALLFMMMALESGRVSSKYIARSLYGMWLRGGAPCEDAEGAMSRLDDAFYLATEGMIGTVAEAEVELRDFLREYAQ